MSDPLVAKMEHKPLRKINGPPIPQDYIAVSYTCGKDDETHYLTCQGAKIPITKTVDGMLRRFRRSDKERRLWIDAICLNQENHVEKNTHIPQMRNIYHAAKKVFVWLGEPVSQDKNPFETLELLRLEQHEPQQFPTTSTGTRRWVIQEISSHPETTIYLGDQKLSLNKFTSTISSLKTYTFKSHEIEKAVRAFIEKIEAMRDTSRPLLELLQRFHTAQCLNERDSLAALQGAAKELLHSEIKHWKVDYNEDIRLNYKRFTEAAIRSGYSKDIYEHLSLFGSLKDIDQAAPVWVPDWTREISTDKRVDRLATLSTLEIEHISLLQKVPVLEMVKAYFQSLRKGPKLDRNDLRRGASWSIDYMKDMESNRKTRKVMESSLREFFARLRGSVMGNCFRLEETVVPILEYILPLSDMYDRYCGGAKIDGKAQDQAGRIAWAWLAVNCAPEITDYPRIIRLAATSSPLDSENVLGTGSVDLDLLDMGFLNDVIVPSFSELFWHYVVFASNTDQLFGIAERDVQIRDRVTWKLDRWPNPFIYRETEHGSTLAPKRIATQVTVVAVASDKVWGVDSIDQRLRERVQNAAAVLTDYLRDHGVRATIGGIPRMLGTRPALPTHYTS